MPQLSEEGGRAVGRRMEQVAALWFYLTSMLGCQILIPERDTKGGRRIRTSKTAFALLVSSSDLLSSSFFLCFSSLASH